MKKIFVTTSWDDGHTLDIKLAEMLTHYNVAGTFYIAPENRELSPDCRLTKEQIRILAQKFEIGAHTITHPRLSKVSPTIASEEIQGSKNILESWADKPVTSFCYPGGDYTSEHKKIVKKSGFTLARTVTRFSTSADVDPFELPTTVHAYRHWSDAASIIKEVGLFRFPSHYLQWDELAIGLFEKVRANGGVFHLWGHSWEIEKNKDWARLEHVLKYIGGHRNVEYVNNSQLI